MKIVFTSGYHSNDDEVTAEKGHRSDVILINNDGNYYELSFVTIKRLESDLRYNIGIGKNYFADVCLIILNEISKNAIITCIKDLADGNYFKRFTPIEKIEQQADWVEFQL